MLISFDPEKNSRNVQMRGLSFTQVNDFDFETAFVEVDLRKEYGETRYVAIGFLHQRLHVLCFTETDDGIRVISFRKANDREVQRYAKTKITS